MQRGLHPRLVCSVRSEHHPNPGHRLRNRTRLHLGDPELGDQREPAPHIEGQQIVDLRRRHRPTAMRTRWSPTVCSRPAPTARSCFARCPCRGTMMSPSCSIRSPAQSTGSSRAASRGTVTTIRRSARHRASPSRRRATRARPSTDPEAHRPPRRVPRWLLPARRSPRRRSRSRRARTLVSRWCPIAGRQRAAVARSEWTRRPFAQASLARRPDRARAPPIDFCVALPRSSRHRAPI
jgi:hypothetical protein